MKMISNRNMIVSGFKIHVLFHWVNLRKKMIILTSAKTICDICKNKNSQCPLCIVTGTYKWFEAKDGCWNCINQINENCKAKNHKVNLSDDVCKDYIKDEELYINI